jgi:hypothetical protein
MLTFLKPFDSFLLRFVFVAYSDFR